MVMNISDRIPTRMIGLLSEVLPDRYTKAQLESLFLYSGAPEEVPDGSKATMVQSWLRDVNLCSAAPLAVLGTILDDFFENRAPRDTVYLDSSVDYLAKFEANKRRINETLTREGLTYIRGGNIVKGGAVSTLSLDDSVKRHGLKSVDIEIQRALSQIEQDPHAAAQYAGNVLEASLKAYLDHHKKTYGDHDTLAELWKVAAEQIGLRPVDWDNKDLKRIASGLNNVVDGIAHLRNAKSGAHGKSEAQRRNITIKPRHARLAIHAAHTVAAYVLELIE